MGKKYAPRLRSFRKIDGFKTRAWWVVSADTSFEDFNVPQSPTTVEFELVFKKEGTKFTIKVRGTEGCCVQSRSFWRGPVSRSELMGDITHAMISRLLVCMVKEGLPEWCAHPETWMGWNDLHICAGSGTLEK